MTTQIPAEADWDQAPGLLEGAMDLELTAADCNLRYWLQAVPQGTLRGRPDGHDPALTVAPYMLEGPFFEAITQEYAFRALAEEKATRVLSYLVPIAPDNDTMEFYATQVLDECRHAMVFRNHLLALGIAPERLVEAVDTFASPYKDSVLGPLEQRSLEIMRDDRDFIGGVVMMTIILEGALAPAAELSERKWRPLDPAAAEIDKGAGIDEIRHLTVGADIARRHLVDHPQDKDRVVELIRRGMDMWEELPTHDMVHWREERFQEGLRRHGDVVGDYEIWPGRRLIDTTPQERQDTADQWSDDMKAKRLKYMGLEEALA
ncbi:MULTISPECIES: VlmB-like protein [unclassified Streptomyces]|uniref:VlmB-like protein n=1 Tax=unclassified Streptomyces TaxID=2593676 RepID=UPI0033301E3E